MAFRIQRGGDGSAHGWAGSWVDPGRLSWHRGGQGSPDVDIFGSFSSVSFPAHSWWMDWAYQGNGVAAPHNPLCNLTFIFKNLVSDGEWKWCQTVRPAGSQEEVVVKWSSFGDSISICRREKKTGFVLSFALHHWGLRVFSSSNAHREISWRNQCSNMKENNIK